MPDFTHSQIGVLSDLLNRMAPNLSLALSEQINHEATLDTPTVELWAVQEMLSRTDPVLQVSFSLSAPLSDESVAIFSNDAARTLAEIMLGGDMTDPEVALSEDQITALNTAMNGLARAFSTALSTLQSEIFDIESSAPHFGPLTVPPQFAMNETVVRARFPVSIPDIIDTEMSFLFPHEIANQMVSMFETSGGGMSGGDDFALDEDDLAAMLSEVGGGSMVDTTPAGHAAAAPQAPFANFPHGPEPTMPSGLELILDIPLDVTVELGRVRMLIKDVLELASGSIVELDRVAGEPVDLLVNGRLVAKGEVVVIEDNFGIRITEIVSPADRVASLGKGR